MTPILLRIKFSARLLNALDSKAKFGGGKVSGKSKIIFRAIEIFLKAARCGYYFNEKFFIIRLYKKLFENYFFCPRNIRKTLKKKIKSRNFFFFSSDSRVSRAKS
jgi:uncharacterized C2H2 Zn-finger protein